jgi:hypothetical protein
VLKSVTDKAQLNTRLQSAAADSVKAALGALSAKGTAVDADAFRKFLTGIADKVGLSLVVFNESRVETANFPNATFRDEDFVYDWNAPPPDLARGKLRLEPRLDPAAHLLPHAVRADRDRDHERSGRERQRPADDRPQYVGKRLHARTRPSGRAPMGGIPPRAAEPAAGDRGRENRPVARPGQAATPPVQVSQPAFPLL